MPEPNHDEKQNVWDDFTPVRHRNLREDSPAMRVFVTIVFLAAGAAGGAILGFFFPVIVLPRHRKMVFWSQNLNEMIEGSLPRVLIGAGVGVVVMASWIWRRN